MHVFSTSQHSNRYHSWCVSLYFSFLRIPHALRRQVSVPSTLPCHLLTWVFTDKLQFKGFQSGQYGSPPSLDYWARQAAVYVVSLTSMKLFVVLLLASWRPDSLDIGAWLLSWLGNGDTAQVVLYVFIWPLPLQVKGYFLVPQHDGSFSDIHECCPVPGS